MDKSMSRCTLRSDLYQIEGEQVMKRNALKDSDITQGKGSAETSEVITTAEPQRARGQWDPSSFNHNDRVLDVQI